MAEQSFHNPIQGPDLEATIAMLQNSGAAKCKTSSGCSALPCTEYPAKCERVGKRASPSRRPFLADGRGITPPPAKRVLKNFIDQQRRQATVDPFQKMPSGQTARRKPTSRARIRKWRIARSFPAC